MWRMFAGLLWSFVLLLGVLAGSSASPAQPAPPLVPPPGQVQQLLQLLQDPIVRGWLDQQQKSGAVAPAEVPATTSGLLTQRVAGLEQHLAALAAAVPRLPSEFRSAHLRLLAELQGRSGFAVFLLVVGFLALGAGSEWIFRQATAGLRWRSLSETATSVSRRLRVLGMRLAFDAFGVLIFAAGSVGAFLAFNWPPLLKQVVVAYLAATIALRLILVLGRFLLAPDCDVPQDTERFRLIQMSTSAARFWQRRLASFVGWFALGWATVDVLSVLGFSPEARQIVAYILGLGLLAIATHTVWTQPLTGSGVVPDQHALARHLHEVAAGAVTACLVLLWAFWVAGLKGLFWLGAVALLLPPAISVAERASRQAAHLPEVGDGQPGLVEVYLGRGVRALLIIGAVLLLAHAWQIDLVEITSRDTVMTRLLRGVLSAVVIQLTADLI